ncbi:MAG: ABC transporter permease [Pseudomonadota bacterium]
MSATDIAAFEGPDDETRAAAATQPARFTTGGRGKTLEMAAYGDWRAPALGGIDADLRVFEERTLDHELIIDVAGVDRLDTAGAMVLQRIMAACKGRSAASRFIGAKKEHAELLDQVFPHLAPCPIEPETRNAFLAMLDRLGLGVVDAYYASLHVLSFIGVTLASFGRMVANPRRFRVTSVVHHMEEAGLNAIPIIGLMSFLIGAVVAFMGAKILQQFNAAIFTVELVAIAVLREFGVLLSAILLAGRSGSAFTAQIGSMKIREEIDAMKSLGLDPVEALVVPRVVALVVMLPALAFIAAILGILGGLIVSWGALEISPALFLNRMQNLPNSINNFWAGLVKAPFFAFVIGIIGCFQGMQVAGSAESLGQRTTLAVVQSLFLVIVLDAFFAMFFLEINF